ncbi:hypothetical protein TVAG_478370 [Trichomonas vaginalis G3]|uniref:Uncharacterized protein n=1 Tax=Trichomonas vaginalis (strain ATCC PRA-98 / G3) TaxID=412133 RepID=A2DZV3_TRIV3|nr:S-adenosylmethionine-dependent tRNA (m5U54) methyltransferase protein [Trichomonas vaginalis G3]EAY14012.1 hypothetical protein TVAG_478370 [Trichomonas vaginalis G3]KAI5519554.1 S-adenosylmethionine-dependent tRNA (m5U54) methyltransferase protein [Trichomonas vaginalis G3]|eukprot:XP_001326235.1 hypothetical protein [Trichomonas vaginalis G3]
MGAFTSGPLSLYVEGFDNQWNDKQINNFLKHSCAIDYSYLQRDSDKKHFIIKFDNQEDLLNGTEKLKKIRIKNDGLKIIKIGKDIQEARKKMKELSTVYEVIPTSDTEILTPFANIPYPAQIRTKELATMKEISSLFNTQFPNITVLPSPLLNFFCNRCVLSIGFNQSNQPDIGFISGTKSAPFIVPLQNTSCFPLEVYEIVKIFKNIISHTKIMPYERLTGSGYWTALNIQIAETGNIITIESHKEIPKDIQDQLTSAYESYENLCIVSKNILTILKGSLTLHQKIYDIDFKVKQSIYLPPNISAFQEFIKYLNEMIHVLGIEELISLNSNYGFLSLCLHEHVKKLTCVDNDNHAIEHSKKTAKNNQIENVEFVNDSSDDSIVNLLSSKDLFKTAVLIEYRKAPSFLDLITNVFNWRPMYVILVAEGTTFPKELSLFKEGYTLFDTILCDMTPHTRRALYCTIHRLDLSEI